MADPHDIPFRFDTYIDGRACPTQKLVTLERRYLDALRQVSR